MILRNALLALVPSVLAAAPAAAPQAQSDFDAAVSWMRGAAAPIESVEVGPVSAKARAELVPIANMIGDARVVALGEEVHGVGTFLTLKHRIFEHLVLERGFRVLILEDSLEEVRKLDQALVAGNVGEVFDKTELAWHVKNSEVRALLEWMEVQNRDRVAADRLRVQGIDIQNVSDAARGLETMLQHLEGGLSSSERETLVAFRDFSWHLGNLPSDARATMSKDLLGMQQRVDSNRTHLVAKTSHAEWELARRRVRLLEQCKSHEEAVVIEPETSHALRDAYLAENLVWVLGQAGPESRAVVFAHNMHASRKGYTASWEETVAPTRSMGAHLAGHLGDDYVAFGAYAYRGPLMSHAGGVTERDGAVSDSWNAAFYRTGHTNFALDLRNVPTTGPAALWWAKEHPQSWGYPIGSSLVVQEHFDALLFVERTTVPGS